MSGTSPLRTPAHALHPDEVHVWHLAADRVDDPGAVGALEALLSPEERARQGRYARRGDRLQFLLARVLARTVLGSYLGRTCGSLHFTTNAYGKPILLRAAGCPGVQFNLTHSHGAIVCAVSPTRDVGIDVEDAGRNLAFLDLADRYFAPPEAAHLRTLPEPDCRAAFFAIWTLKEAFVKALGQGLTYPLDAFAFELDRDRLVGFRPLAPDVSPHWHFFQFRLGDRHRGAVAAQGDPARPVRLRMFDWAAEFLPGE